MAFTRDINQQIASSLGFTGQAGGGSVDAWLAQNPQLIGQYTAARQQAGDAGYAPNAQLQQVQSTYNAPPPAPTPFASTNQQIASSLGFTGQAGGGAVDAWLAQNPELIPEYTAIRQSVDPGYVPNAQLQQAVQPFLNQINPEEGGVVPVGQIEPFNQLQKDALQKLGVDLSDEFLQRASQYSDLTQGTFGQVSPLIDSATQRLSGEDIQQGVNQYLNPYLDDVLQSSLSEINQQAARERNRINSRYGDGFGSSAQGVEQGLLSQGLLDAIGGTTANIKSTGFNTALDAFLGRRGQEQGRELEGATRKLAQSALAGDLSSQAYSQRTGNIADQLRAGTAIQQQNQATLDILRPEIAADQTYTQDQIARLGQLLGLFPSSSRGDSSSGGASNLGKAGGLLTTIGGLF